MSEQEAKRVRKMCPKCAREFTGILVVCQNDGTLLIPVRSESLQADRLPDGSICVAKRYKFEKILHNGTSSVFALVKDLEQAETVKALKMMITDRDGPVAVRKSERFMRQADRQERLHHKNIVSVLDHGEGEARRPFIIFEYVDGFSLAQAKQALQTIPFAYTLEALSQACDALEYATEHGAVHNDLSPNDILICGDENDSLTVKVTDFSKGDPLLHGDNQNQQLTECGDIFGTPEYMSPESCYRSNRLDARSNVYSLGCILFDMVSVGNPFIATHWGAVLLAKLQPRTLEVRAPWLASDLASALEKVINRCVQKEPEDRYQTLSELKSELQYLYNSADALPFDRVRQAVKASSDAKQQRK